MNSVAAMSSPGVGAGSSRPVVGASSLRRAGYRRLAAGCPAGQRVDSAPPDPSPEGTADRESEDDVSELTFYVAGMACRRCVREVTARLRDVPGVDTVTADVAASLVRLGGSMRAEDVVAALAGTPYRPEPR
jgi:copper chaperone CopZ